VYTASNSEYYYRPYETEAEKFTRQFYRVHKKRIERIVKESAN
jgi:hypothetical protein